MKALNDRLPWQWCRMLPLGLAEKGFLTASQLLDTLTCTQTLLRSRMNTKPRFTHAEVISCALLNEALFSVCFIFLLRIHIFFFFFLQTWHEWVFPVGYHFTFVTRSLCCPSSAFIQTHRHTLSYIQWRVIHEREKNKNTHDPSLQAQSLAAVFPPPAQGHRDKMEKELLLVRTGKKSQRERKRQQKMRPLTRALSPNQQEVQWKEEGSKERTHATYSPHPNPWTTNTPS